MSSKVPKIICHALDGSVDLSKLFLELCHLQKQRMADLVVEVFKGVGAQEASDSMKLDTAVWIVNLDHCSWEPFQLRPCFRSLRDL